MGNLQEGLSIAYGYAAQLTEYAATAVPASFVLAEGEARCLKITHALHSGAWTPWCP